MQGLVGFAGREHREGESVPSMEMLKRNIESLNAVRKANEDKLHQVATQEREQYDRVVDQKVAQHEYLLTQQFKEQVMRLTQAAQARRADLEKSAFEQKLGYQQKKVQEVYVEQQTKIEQEYMEEQKHLTAEIQKLREQHGPTPPLVDINPKVCTPGLFPAMHGPVLQTPPPPPTGYAYQASPLRPHPGVFSPVQVQPPVSFTGAPWQPAPAGVPSPSGSMLMSAAPPGSMLMSAGSMEWRHTPTKAAYATPQLIPQSPQIDHPDARLLRNTEVMRELDNRRPESDSLDNSDDEETAWAA